MEHVRYDAYKTGRKMYILEAALEYFISLLIADAYLAKLTAYVGMSDAMTGILSAFVSLGCGVQIVAVFFGRMRSVKRFVTVGHTFNQLLFALVYLTPFLPIRTEHRSIFMLICLLMGHIVANTVHAAKINWFMSMVEDGRRGVFTANKEIVSLLGGMLFTFAMGNIIDRYEAKGELEAAFLLCGFVLLGLTALHTVTMLVSKEPPRAVVKKGTGVLALLKNKQMMKIVLLSILWHIAQYATAPFYGSYKVGTLGFSMALVTGLSAAGSLLRAACSRRVGRLADKYSFAVILIPCFALWGIGYVLNAFAVPQNGVVMFALYTVLHAVAMAGVNSGTINLIYDYVEREQRVAALALQNSIAGIVGFLTTLACSTLVDHIQQSGNTFLGISLYPQQLLSAFGAVMMLLLALYTAFVVRRIKRPAEEPAEV